MHVCAHTSTNTTSPPVSKVATLKSHTEHLDDVVNETNAKISNEAPDVEAWQAYLDLHHSFLQTLEADVRDAQRRINGQKAKDKQAREAAAKKGGGGPDDEDEDEDEHTGNDDDDGGEDVD